MSGIKTPHRLVPVIALTLAVMALAGCLGGDPPPQDADDNMDEDNGFDDNGDDNGNGNGNGGDDGNGDDDSPPEGVQASFTVEPEDPTPGQEAIFDASGSHTDDQEATFSWEFGDGSTGEGESVGHTFEVEGEYEVTLNVTTEDGQSDSATRFITVAELEGGLNETYEGSMLLGFPVESGTWMDDHDMNAEVPQADVEITLEGSGTLASFTLSLLDADGNEIASDSGTEAQITQSELEAGSYTVRVHMTGGIQGEYTVSVIGTPLPVEDDTPPDDPGTQ